MARVRHRCWAVSGRLWDLQITHSKAPVTYDGHTDLGSEFMLIIVVHFLVWFFLVVVDGKSKCLEVIPMSNTTGQTTVNALHSLFAIHSLSEEIVSVNGPPASNSKAERAVRTFNQAMKAAKPEPGAMPQKPCSFLLSYRTRLCKATRCTPPELLMNRRLRTRLALIPPSFSEGYWKWPWKFPNVVCS